MACFAVCCISARERHCCRESKKRHYVAADDAAGVPRSCVSRYLDPGTVLFRQPTMKTPVGSRRAGTRLWYAIKTVRVNRDYTLEKVGFKES